ncbi:D-2-hydroxyglutarate dehydrogenase YdiJ [Larsenimonas rhizosphaerae]|uniref:D-2-hydroxyglutarate dehydrogenase n=1 Tax=Larsenimonas rhizosphaerae TaxID=2944682 RepID=A0AA42CX08_9GAMM|nr:FAD-binding and (Fe-S)-binding domain-containing protein [Larsenimonas rhizosphaerae]MCX2523313.1 FAD-binding and (Fe-S)-binding domain-containing protein [Larsenimonas rhizosphaerae]
MTTISTEHTPHHADVYGAFLTALKDTGFEGDIATRDADRTVLATDNSIYERTPQAALFPRHQADLVRIATLAGESRFQTIVLTPRGGGTGTNGQSLTEGLVVDVTRYMNRILDIDVAGRRVVVEPGVVKDQLNAALKPHGLFFAPELSTSNRATIGGMISTDASGQGSCSYGKTRNHVLGLKTALIGGEVMESAPVDDRTLDDICQQPSASGRIHATLRKLIDQHHDAIMAGFPPLNRCLTGYDLPHLRTEDGRLDPNSVLCGAEGSLGLITEATLNVLPIPRHSALINVRYEGFMDALSDARALMACQPTSIETIDDTVLLLAMDDMVWDSVADYFPPNATSANGHTPQTRGINLVEFNDDDEQALADKVAAFIATLEKGEGPTRLGYTKAWGRSAISTVYAMRKRAVGLLGNARGEQRPLPFVEDTAVPPDRLPEYIQEFRALLDSHGLRYGMFGHVDAGVLHVRPAMDMRDPAQAALVRPISDAVAALTQRHGGLLWGEHGKGIRSEYTPAFFGALYPLLQEVKQAFDPHNQLNPGKIATPPASTDELLKIDGVTFRGDLDRNIDDALWNHYSSAVYCNGNGACFNYDPDDAMCPSWKATRDRVHSPKGRAMLFKEWLRRESHRGQDIVEEARMQEQAGRWQKLRQALQRRLSPPVADPFIHEVHEAMSGCLSCKSCAGQCPIKVNVPDFKSQFMAIYQGRYGQPLRNHLVGSLEGLLPFASRFTPLYNAWINSRAGQRLFKAAGMVDTPAIDRAALDKVLESWGVPVATPITLARLTPEARARSVIMVQDAFTRYFDSQVIRDVVTLLNRLGIQVFVAPFLPNGKPAQVMGQLGRFERIARRNARHLKALADFDVPLVGVDPAMTLTYRQEYPKVLGQGACPEVLLLQEWLVTLAGRWSGSPVSSSRHFRLLSHCTEKTSAGGSPQAWQQVFKAFGLSLELVPAGCCGMSGTYGHEAEHRELSERIYDMSWRPIVEQTAMDTRLLATGYSCRSQVSRFSQTQLMHPLQGLLEALEGTRHASPAASR